MLEFLAQALVMFISGGEPDTIVFRARRLVAQEENNFFSATFLSSLLNVNGEASEHEARAGR